MRAMWRGSISFGLINVPVKMYASKENRSIRFRQIHRECGTPIKYQKVCPSCNREVKEDEIGKGYEFEKGKFVIIEDSDLEKIPDKTTRTIDIIDFVNLKEIDPIYYDNSYFLGPEETGQKAYVLLRKAMKEGGKIAIAKVVIRSKQNLACIRPYGKKHIIMETMLYPDEVRNVEDIPLTPKAEPSDAEVKMALQLVESLSTDFNPEKYTDDYRSALLDIIEAKIQGQEISTPTPREEKVVDLMEALKASLAEAEKQKEKVTVG